MTPLPLEEAMVAPWNYLAIAVSKLGGIDKVAKMLKVRKSYIELCICRGSFSPLFAEILARKTKIPASYISSSGRFKQTNG